MLISYKEFENLDLPMLQSVVSQRVEEGHYLDYKLNVTRPMGTADKKEFLKDISGFANAGGGLLIYGCDEPKNQPTWHQQLMGLPNGRDLAEDMERIAATGLDPRIPGLRFKAIPLSSSTNYCIVVYVPPSSVKPHMVTLDKVNRFHLRHSESTNPMTTQEVRTAVLSAYNREEAIEEMRADVLRGYDISEFNQRCSLVLQAIPLTDFKSHGKSMTIHLSKSFVATIVGAVPLMTTLP